MRSGRYFYIDECVACRELFEADLTVLRVDIFFHKIRKSYEGIIKDILEMQDFYSVFIS